MVEEFRQQRKIHVRFAFQIVMDSLAQLQALPTLVDVSIPNGASFTVCGVRPLPVLLPHHRLPYDLRVPIMSCMVMSLMAMSCCKQDVHGQFYDLLHIFELNGLPSEDNPYLFNGSRHLTARSCLLSAGEMSCQSYVVTLARSHGCLVRRRLC